MNDPNHACCLCEHETLIEISAFATLHRVTSDVRPWEAGGELAVCGRCGTVQKPRTDKWHAEIANTYETYDLYHQSGGEDHPVFDQTSGLAAGRSTCLIRNLVQEVSLGKHGRILDVGCGKGGFLSAFQSCRPGWQLEGFDQQEAGGQALESIPGIAAYHSDSVEGIPGTFDLIVLNHVLEHVPEPTTFLVEIGRKLGPAGRLVVQVPNIDRNPYDLVVVDHCIHFGTGSLRQLVSQAGFAIDVFSENWLPKELTLVARPVPGGERIDLPDEYASAASRAEHIRATVDWLHDTAADASACAQGDNGFGIFGTSIAALWLDAQTDGVAQYFCDEDPARHGRTLKGRPIVNPGKLEPPKTVYMPLAPEIAQAIAARLGGSGIDLTPAPPVPVPPNG